MDTNDRKSSCTSLSRRLVSNRLILGALGLSSAGLVSRAQAKAPVTEKSQDQADIEQLIYRYARALDDRDPDAFADCFSPGTLSLSQVTKVIDFHRKFEYTVHNVLNHIYTVHDRTATGMHYSLVCYVKNINGQLTKFDTYARYEDVELTKREGRWFFTQKMRWAPIFSTAEQPIVIGVPAGFSDGWK